MQLRPNEDSRAGFLGRFSATPKGGQIGYLFVAEICLKTIITFLI